MNIFINERTEPMLCQQVEFAEEDEAEAEGVGDNGWKMISNYNLQVWKLILV